MVLFVAATLYLSGQSSSQQTAQRDQQAITILTQAVAVAGGSDAMVSIRDFTENGTVTYFWSEKASGDITIKARGLDSFRIDSNLPDGIRTVILNRGSGVVKEIDGTHQLIPHADALSLSSLTLPYPLLEQVLNDLSISVQSLGLVTHRGTQMYELRTRKTLPQSVDPTGVSKRATLDIFIDPATFLITSIRVPLHSSFADPTNSSHEVVYSQYQMTNGVAVPRHIAQIVHGQILMEMQLSGITFNAGLADDTFNLSR